MSKKEELGKRISMQRAKHGISQAQLGALIGKSQSTVYGYESGDIMPSFETLIKISQVFEVSIGYLLDLRASMPSNVTLRELYDLYFANDGEENE